MKLIIREYLASLRERDELDAILPDILSERGFNVYSRPRRGTTQHGVDIAAIGPTLSGERAVFLFSVKQGNLGKPDWNGGPQALRPSLDEIRDAYIGSKIPKEYADLKIIICLCFGGEVLETVRQQVTGYIKENSNDRISFEEWSGDKIADLVLTGILREEILPSELRQSFRKSVAMVDEPDISYRHFSDLLRQLVKSAGDDHNRLVRSVRQINICLWILFVWARSVDNVEASYRASELALLSAWHLLRPLIDIKSKQAEEITEALYQLITLHLAIAEELFEKKIFPHIGKHHALSAAIRANSSVDINLRLFECLGRIAMTGIWLSWLSEQGKDIVGKELFRGKAVDWCARGHELINNNTALLSPLCESQSIEVALMLILSSTAEKNEESFGWLKRMVNRLDFSVRTHGKYPCVHSEYRELIEHPRSKTEEYRKDATSGSFLIPLLASWMTAFGDNDSLRKLLLLKESILQHCTLQLWLPDSESENMIYIGGRDHGVALVDLPLQEGGNGLLTTISLACNRVDFLGSLSAMTTGYWPIVLLACRHHRLPVPPQFWLGQLLPDEPT